jgi:AcrR family transcriptional regulator
MPRSKSETSVEEGAARRRGRPRDASIDPAIALAAWQVLNERGYGDFSFEEVALLAGCSRPALYRRFSHKRDLIVWLVESEALAIDATLPGDVSPRQALVDQLAGFSEFLKSPAGISVAVLAHARIADPSLSDALDRQYERLRLGYEAALRRALPARLPDRQFFGLVDNMIGAVAFRVGLQRRAMSRRDIEDLVDQTIAWGSQKAANSTPPTKPKHQR